MRVRGVCSGARRWRWCAAALAACAAALLRLPVAEEVRAHMPHTAPATIAHYLADFSNQLVFYPYIDSWSVVEDRGNYTSWQYVVQYSCGSRCAGQARVAAHEQLAAEPRHGAPARDHRLHIEHRQCTHLPLLPWPQLCEELETEALVSADGSSGARLSETTRVRCAAPLALSGTCAARLRDAAERRLHRLRLDLDPRHAHPPASNK